MEFTDRSGVMNLNRAATETVQFVGVPDSPSFFDYHRSTIFCMRQIFAIFAIESLTAKICTRKLQYYIHVCHVAHDPEPRI